MCRIAAYLGHSILVSQVVTEPKHSIIHQSYHAQERSEPLNGDGFGIAWFVPEVSNQPALFKDVSPAWNNDNLLEISRVTRSHCIMAHVRAASPHSPVQRLNCHPFAHGSLAFMHNGGLASFAAYRRQLLGSLTDEAFSAILGSTDSEHAFAVLLDYYARFDSLGPQQRLVESMQCTIERLEWLRRSAHVTEPSSYNFAVSDGSCVVATRFSSDNTEAASLYSITGGNLRCEDGHYRLDFDTERDVVIVASERLGPSERWCRVEPGHLLLATHPGKVEVLPLRALNEDTSPLHGTLPQT